MPCKHAQSSAPTYSVCGLKLYGGKPSHGTCVRCEHNTDRAWHEKQVQVMLTVGAPPIRPSIAPQTPVAAIPRAEWPMWAKGLAVLAKPEDKGIGDTVERLAKVAGAKSLVEFAKDKGLPDCGCADRKARWNQQYPMT